MLFSLESNCNIEVKVNRLKAGICDFSIKGVLRISLGPLLDELPLIGAITIAFVEEPVCTVFLVFFIVMICNLSIIKITTCFESEHFHVSRLTVGRTLTACQGTNYALCCVQSIRILRVTIELLSILISI